jgi:hypothetical protein
MADAGLVSLLVRTVVSLAVVLAVVGVAYVVARRRAGGRPSRPMRTGVSRGQRAQRRRSAPSPIEVVGRAGLNRGTVAVAVRFGDRVVLIGASEQAPTTVLAEMDAERWDELNVVREPLPTEHMVSVPVGGAPARPSLLDALRAATARHA